MDFEAVFDAYAPGSTPDVTAMASPFSFGGLAPEPLDDGDAFHRPSSPAIVVGAGAGLDLLHDELLQLGSAAGASHPEVLTPPALPGVDDMAMADVAVQLPPALPDAFAPAPAPLSSSSSPAAHVPDVASSFFGDEEEAAADARLYHDLLSLDGDDVGVKAEPGVKREFNESVPELPGVKKTGAPAGKSKKRPPRGPGSRRKLQEEIRDDLDATIYSLFPADKLRLPKADFVEWRETSGIRRLSGPERKRLAEIRRMILARVYAERNRLRKIEESNQSGERLEQLQAENAQLRRKAAKLAATEAKLKKLQAEISRLRGSR